MRTPLIHWSYVRSEATHRWKRTALTVAGIAMAVALVVLLDVLGRSFADVAVLPFRSLSADLIVQRSATSDALPSEMGVIVPYSAQPISATEMSRLASEPGIEKATGFVLLWNLGAGRFFSISGVDFNEKPPLLGPSKIRTWLFKGRMPKAGQQEVLVERHYGAFYKLKPGKTIKLAGRDFFISGIVDIKGGSKFGSSNFYMDINLARKLAKLPGDEVNQVFLKVSRISETETIKKHIASWLPQSSIVSPGSVLKLFGGISQIIGRFRSVAIVAGGLAAGALIIMLLYGAMAERSKEAGVLQTLGWTRSRVRRQLMAETAFQGIVGGLLALGLVAIGLAVLGNITLQLPTGLPGENPVNFARGGFAAPPQSVALPVSASIWDWALPPIVAGVFCALVGWLLSAKLTAGSLWTAIKGG